MTREEFKSLLANLANAWMCRDYPTAISCFAADVRYMDPLRYSFGNTSALQKFFEADDGMEQRVTWHTLIFDEAEQAGAAEYTYVGSHTYHGVAIVKVADGKIVLWREHQHIDARPWEIFAGFDGKC